MKKINQELVDQIRKCRKDGESIKTVANKFNVGVASVQKYTNDIILSDEQKDRLKLNTLNGNMIRMQKERKKKNDFQKENGWKIQTATIDKNYNPKRIGDNSVIQIMACFSDDDRIILTPFGDNERYDLVIEENGNFIRVQCKTGKVTLDKFQFKTSSNNWNTGKITDYKSEADVFAVYIRENKKVYIFKVNNCPIRMCSVRFLESKQSSTNRMAIDHEYVNGKSLLDYE